ncbi:GTPase, putative [Plasmodium berghei]|uniref:tRNA modification GTPase, putative n=2 Tax=Plasmodium berghei TaxID=5821 RepID=A0A509AHU5_PLABA|nr:tRNA modification GTPase, putative [Plasmodium berghei ANKA]SCM20400.1 GTPase, putative [Plasmodium berghei]SCN23992.1 GTPase, putative [Plasmodium berghei]SCO60449.1 GTPase, putative [Plasmodium berghei]VUC55063.1 tRNA modification GTPase, putative [Plasmodium berghei ANKA]|eukprot:XP_034420882.1 tRNA modification GTPase, putative [Plasmodium berghei ANKA]
MGSEFLFLLIKYIFVIYFLNYCNSKKRNKQNNTLFLNTCYSDNGNTKYTIRRRKLLLIDNKTNICNFLSYKNKLDYRKKNEIKDNPVFISSKLYKNEEMKKDQIENKSLNDFENQKINYIKKIIHEKETIYALSSGTNLSAISIIRISGSLSKIILEILLHKDVEKKDDKINSYPIQLSERDAKKKKKKKWNLEQIIKLKKNIESRKLYYSKIYDNSNDIIDNVIYAYFKSPNSYTGEDVVEIYCHGNPFIVKEIMNAIDYINNIMYEIINEEKEKIRIRNITHDGNYNYNNEYCNYFDKIEQNLFDLNNFIKIRESKKGEFTQRAFENNKMNLLQIEGLKELLFCKQKIQKKIALNYLNGYAKNIYLKLRNNIRKLLVYIQLKIDFEDEHITTKKKKKYINMFIKKKVRNAIKHIKAILKRKNIESLNTPSNVLIFGNVNAGKSTFMNYICNSDISIVTKIKGTTIDIIQKNVKIFNNDYNLCDSAGISTLVNKKFETNKNIIEKDKKKKSVHKKLESIGIRKTLQFLESCSSVLVLININNYFNELKNIISLLNVKFMKKTKKTPYFFVCINKCDLEQNPKKLLNIKNNIKKMLLKLTSHIFKKFSKKIFFISSKKGYNINKLLSHFNKTMIKIHNIHNSIITIKTNKKKKKKKHSIENSNKNIYFLPFERHKIYLKESLTHLCFVQKNINIIDFDIIAEEIKLAVKPLHEIIGKISNDQILANILDNFCIGK